MPGRVSNDIDLAAMIADVTESLGVDTPPASQSPTASFALHKATMGHGYALVKVFAGLPQGSLSPTESKAIKKEFLTELGYWKQNFFTEHFVNIIGYSDYIDSVLPCPVYLQTMVAKDYLKGSKKKSLLPFIMHVVEAVDQLHQKEVCHGDIRADNVLVGTDGLPRLSDFGVSRVISLLEKHKCRHKTDVNAAIRWMPPEFMQLDDDAPYAPSREGDIWSLGMTIYELWSGYLPYRGIALERLPSRISRGQFPGFPGELIPDLEVLREHINFLCGLCWKTDPSERVAAPYLVHILHELIEGKTVSVVSKEFELWKHRQSPLPGNAGASLFLSGGSSIASSDTYTEDSGDTVNVERVVCATNSSDSEYATVTRRSVTRQTTVKKEEPHENASTSVSSWSHKPAQNKGIANASAFQSMGNVQSGQFTPTPKSEGSHLPRFDTIPAPPSPDSPFASVTSFMTALLNYKAKHKLNALDITQQRSGEAHQLAWTTICTINGVVYGSATETTMKKADEMVAEQALTRLYDENPSLVVNSLPSYLPTFKMYLETNKISNRIDMRCEQSGLAHSPTWTCTVFRDGVMLDQGVGTTKPKALEMGAKKAAAAWNRQS